MWFRIKRNSNCTDGAKNLWYLIKSSRYLPKDLLKIIDPVIQRNGYYSHSENILLAMSLDENIRYRQQAFDRIVKARESQASSTRIFKIPTINMAAETYVDMIDWESPITDPPLMKSISNTDLRSIILNNCNKELFKLPCHTQAVERNVKVYISS